MPDGYHVAPDALAQVSGQLKGASQTTEDGASEPPVPQAGSLTGLFGQYLAQLCEAMGNVSSGAAAAAEAVSQNQDMYVTTEYEAAAAFAAQHQQ